MGDVNAGQLKWLLFFIVFLSMFSLLGYTFTVTASTGVPYVSGSIGNITPQDIGVTGYIDVYGYELIYPTVSYDFSLGATDTIDLRISWNDLGGGNVRWGMSTRNSWWIIPLGSKFCYMSLMYQNHYTDGVTNITQNGPIYYATSYNTLAYSKITNAMIIANWDSTKNYTKLICTPDPAIGITSPQSGKVWFMFIQDYDNDPLTGRNNITAAIADGKVLTVFARQTVAPNAGNILGFITWIFNIITFQQTWGLNGIPVFNTMLVLFVVGTTFSLVSVVKSLVSGWL